MTEFIITFVAGAMFTLGVQGVIAIFKMANTLPERPGFRIVNRHGKQHYRKLTKGVQP